jgi:hypothetical protein
MTVPAGPADNIRTMPAADLLPIVAGGAITLAGGIVATVAESRRSRRADDAMLMREERARDAANKASADAFQRETLLELQDWAHKLTRNSVRAHHETDMEFLQAHTFGRKALPEDINGMTLEATINVRRLRVRVADDQVRREAEELIKHASAVAMPAPRGTTEPHTEARLSSELAVAMTLDASERLNERIGTLLRGGASA